MWINLARKLSKKNNTKIMIDSEHFSIFKLLENHKIKILKTYITASGGPFLNYLPYQLKKLSQLKLLTSKEDGQKISITQL